MKPFDLDPALVQRVVRRAVPAPVLGRQRQPDQGSYRPIGTEHRVGELEQRVDRVGRQAQSRF
ncbi:hypothetical protein GCU69_30820 [Streptomyces lycii]|uniref:Uncharacterized protein n=1 Tax=Streptomyces lycii TaxID=2654337 RepID=A0ABQ7F9S1_9ACTN|nr:hypothetical protein GCU69_30820 [Streptomyces lycii]